MAGTVGGCEGGIHQWRSGKVVVAAAVSCLPSMGTDCSPRTERLFCHDVKVSRKCRRHCVRRRWPSSFVCGLGGSGGAYRGQRGVGMTHADFSKERDGYFADTLRVEA